MIKHLFAVGLLSSTLCTAAFAGAKEETQSNGGTVVIEIDGSKVTLQEFERRHPSTLFQARNTFHDTAVKALDEFVDELLLERQAKKENLTVDQLLERHVKKMLPKDPSDDAIRVYLEGVDTQESFATAREKVIAFLRDKRMTKAKAEYVKSLRAQSNVAIRLSPPRANISIENAQVSGRLSAPVTMIEYADYECPYCQQIAPQIEKLREEYKDKLTFAYKNLPLPNHANAQKAAEAAQCAAAQGKFWEYHSHIYKTKEYSLPRLKEDARTLKLDGEAFDKCVDSGEKAALVKAQFAEAQALSIPGTPAFFINGRFISGAVTYESLRQVVEDELKASAVTQANERTSGGTGGTNN